MGKQFDAIIIGGSYAGLSAAMALGRSLRNTLIIDSNEPCNRQTPHSHNFLTQDGKTPAEISALARQQVQHYDTVRFYNGLATEGKKTTKGFEISTQSGDSFTGKKLIFATGITDVMPDIKGLASCWGISVIHCPYCHGYEYRNQNTAIMANGDKAFHIASLVNNLTNNISILTNGRPDFTSDQTAILDRHKIRIVDETISEIEHQSGKIGKVVFSNGEKTHVDVMYAAIPFTQHTDIPPALGCELTEQCYIEIDNMQKTTVEGVFACGDNSSPMRSIATAVANGNAAGAMVNKELTEANFR